MTQASQFSLAVSCKHLPRLIGFVELTRNRFVVLSRATLAIIIAVLACPQVGLPETFLYEQVEWLCAGSTPFWLGVGETVYVFLLVGIDDANRR